MGNYLSVVAKGFEKITPKTRQFFGIGFKSTGLKPRTGQQVLGEITSKVGEMKAIPDYMGIKPSCVDTWERRLVDAKGLWASETPTSFSQRAITDKFLADYAAFSPEVAASSQRVYQEPQMQEAIRNLLGGASSDSVVIQEMIRPNDQGVVTAVFNKNGILRRIVESAKNGKEVVTDCALFKGSSAKSNAIFTKRTILAADGSVEKVVYDIKPMYKPSENAYSFTVGENCLTKRSWSPEGMSVWGQTKIYNPQTGKFTTTSSDSITTYARGGVGERPRQSTAAGVGKSLDTTFNGLQENWLQQLKQIWRERSGMDKFEFGQIL